MKTIQTVLALLIFFFTVACDKEPGHLKKADVPDAVMSAFNSAHPDARDVEWEKEGEYYEVEFEEGRVEMEIVYDIEGNVIETEIEIDVSDLPDAIVKYINDNYSDYKIDEAEKIENGEGVLYEVEIEYKRSELELMFDGNGNFLGEDDEGEDDNGHADVDDENEREINLNELPQSILHAITSQYPDAELLEADEITHADGRITYDVEIRYNRKVIEPMYNADGTFLGEEEDDDDEDEDEDEDDDD